MGKQEYMECEFGVWEFLRIGLMVGATPLETESTARARLQIRLYEMFQLTDDEKAKIPEWREQNVNGRTDATWNQQAERDLGVRIQRTLHDEDRERLAEILTHPAIPPLRWRTNEVTALRTILKAIGKEGAL